MIKDLTRYLLIALGTFCVVLGIIGMFIPLIPTTPFLLLAAYFYSRSSEKFYQWLLSNRWFGKYIRNYRQGRGLPRKQKLLTILILWLTIGYTVFFMASQFWLQFVLVIIAVAVTIHLIKIKTYLTDQEYQIVVRNYDSSEESA